MSFRPHTEADRKTMLDRLGLTEIEQLFEDLPKPHLFPDLDLPQPISELELMREMALAARKNVDVSERPCFLGAGAYRHFIPSTVDAVLRRGELYTAYTPYQPEISQGMLQAMFEYQSMICTLFEMEVSTASHYDGATAMAEAVLMALAAGGSKRRRIVVPGSLHPQYLQVLRTYLEGTDAEVWMPEGLDPDHGELLAQLDETVAACVLQSPNFFGQFEPVEQLTAATHDAGALAIVVPDPIASGLFRAPGEQGADLVAADGQSLGIPLSFGGPHLGILATRGPLVRRLPGRLVGETVDSEGQRGYVLTLGTREQHIRREKATSNICTNAALMALAAATYLATLGKAGLREVAASCFHKSHYLAGRLALLDGCRVNPQAPEKPFFKELVLELPVSAARVNRVLFEKFDIVGGYELAKDFPEMSHHLLLAVTELSTRDDLDRLVAALDEITNTGGEA